jgi:hypothetical protein
MSVHLKPGSGGTMTDLGTLEGRGIWGFNNQGKLSPFGDARHKGTGPGNPN